MVALYSLSKPRTGQYQRRSAIFWLAVVSVRSVDSIFHNGCDSENRENNSGTNYDRECFALSRVARRTRCLMHNKKCFHSRLHFEAQFRYRARDPLWNRGLAGIRAQACTPALGSNIRFPARHIRTTGTTEGSRSARRQDCSANSRGTLT